MPTSTFASRLRAGMAASGISPADLAKRLSVSKATIYRWLSSSTTPSIDGDIMISLADILHLSGRYLLRNDSTGPFRLGLSEQETELIERFRELSEAQRAEFLLQIKSTL